MKILLLEDDLELCTSIRAELEKADMWWTAVQMGRPRCSML